MANYFCTDSVEEQVDYLTDKVKDLKTNKLDKAAIVQGVGTGTDVVMSQKAVTDTINENLQTVNTEISGKLTAPAKPTAESAVTMLADGTVGTKLLSEIGGGVGDLNLENGTGTGSLQQKGITYNELITDYEPNMAAWVIAKNGNAVPANVSVYLTALGNDTVPTSEQVVDILNNRVTDVNTVITNFKILPSPYDSYGIDNLIAGALAGYGLTSSSDLSNIVGKTGSAAAILGAMNKAFSPGAFAGGVGCEAGDEGYPGDTICSFSYGSNVKTKGICSVGIGRDLENLGDTSAVFGRGNKEYKIEGNEYNKQDQTVYLNNLAEAGGKVKGSGDNRVGITGINKGTNSLIAGNDPWNGADNSTILGNQNIIGKNDFSDGNPCANNFIGNGLINFIDRSNSCAILGWHNIIKSSTAANLFGYYLKAEGRTAKTVVGSYNEDKANTYFEVGNGTSETDRKNAFEVLKDGTIRVPNFNSSGSRIGMATLKVVNGVLTITT